MIANVMHLPAPHKKKLFIFGSASHKEPCLWTRQDFRCTIIACALPIIKNKLNNVWRAFTHLSISSRQFGLFRPAQRSFTPESSRSLLLRSSSISGESDDCKTDARISQHWSVILQPARLNENKNTVSVDVMTSITGF